MQLSAELAYFLCYTYVFENIQIEKSSLILTNAMDRQHGDILNILGQITIKFKSQLKINLACNIFYKKL